MSDTGRNLKGHIKDNIEKKDFYIKEAVGVLAGLHNKDFAHGGSQIRNFTIKDEKISLIDFEEKIPEKYLNDFKVRDILIFLLSLEKTGFDPDVKEICSIYEEKSGIPVYDRLKKLILKFKWGYFLKSNIFKKIKMKDVRDFLTIIEKFDR